MYVFGLIGFNMCVLQKFNVNVLFEFKYKKKKLILIFIDEFELKIVFVKKKVK